MTAVAIYDSTYGTNKIAEAIDGRVLKVEDVRAPEVQASDLLIVGTATHQGFPTEGVFALGKDESAVAQMDVAAFGTRTKRTGFGCAAPKLARSLEKRGAILRAPPEGFFGTGRRRPLKEGEPERAAAWSKELTV